MPYDWLMGLAGGMLIGLAASLKLIGHGRIAGISGILGGAMRLEVSGLAASRWMFLAGLLLGPLAVWLVDEKPAIVTFASTPLLIAGGLLVGFGTRLGSGCTSGHGVCGLSRFSRRSIVATITFMGVAAAVLLVVRHGLGVAA